MEVAGANRRWRCQFRYRGSRRESAVAQLFSLGSKRAHLTMSKKIMNPQRWRFIIVVTVVDAIVLASCVPFYLKEPADKKPVLLGLAAMLLCIGFVGIGIMIALWRRFPVPDEDDKNERH
jgi:hypothetical protein